jgi:hypothetical protein
MVRWLLAATLAQTLIPAFIGLLGVLVGSALTWMREAHRQRGETIAASRLVGAELADTAKKLGLPTRQQDRSTLATQLLTPSWDERRSELALGLSPQEWGDVREAFASVSALRLVLASDSAELRDIGDRVAEARDRIESAQNALKALERRERRRALPHHWGRH